MKALNAPHKWMVHKMNGIFAPRPSSGPHKLVECLPLTLIIRNRLHLARDMRESGMIIRNKNVLVDGKTRTDEGYPTGFMDVVSIPKCNMNFRMMYDTKGRFHLTPIKGDECNYKLLRINNVIQGDKGIFYGTCHDGHNIRFLDPKVKVGDTVKYNLKTCQVEAVYKFETNAIAQVTCGNNSGRIGKIQAINKYDGSYNMITLVDEAGSKFITRVENVFVLGKDKPEVTLPRARGIRVDIVENRKLRLASIAKQHANKEQ